LINASDGASDGVEAELLLQERPLAEQALVRPVVRRVVGLELLITTRQQWCSMGQHAVDGKALKAQPRVARASPAAAGAAAYAHCPLPSQRSTRPDLSGLHCLPGVWSTATTPPPAPSNLLSSRNGVELKVNSRRIHLIPFATSSTVIFRIRHPTYPLLTAQYEYGVAPGV